MADVAVGMDITSVTRVAALLARRPRFTDRFFTEIEVRDCAGQAERFASRWAAKEAVRKLAGSSGIAMPAWRDIEVVLSASGAPIARVRGWRDTVAISLSHDGDLASAVAMAVGGAGPGGLPGDLPPLVTPPPEFMLPARPESANKSTFGRVVVVAGSRGLTGAAYLAATAAARGGAGLVSLHVPEAVYSILAMKCVEVMAHPLAGGDTVLSGIDVHQFARDFLWKAQALVIGPGLGGSEATASAVIDILVTTNCPTVVDADGLNHAATADFSWRECKQPLVLTPHPGEMARLTGLSVSEIQGRADYVALNYAREHNVTVVLKDSVTVIAAPDGRIHDHRHPLVSLATGGTGDVLAGLCGAMLAQGMEAFAAARAAVLIHSEAAAWVQATRGRAGSLAGDVLEELPAAQERLRRWVERDGRAATHSGTTRGAVPRESGTGDHRVRNKGAR